MATNRIVGYYDSPEQTVAAFDPGVAAPCPICGYPWTDETVRTVSIMRLEGGRSYFYRVHRRCHDQLTQAEEVALDERMFALGEKEQP